MEKSRKVKEGQRRSKTVGEGTLEGTYRYCNCEDNDKHYKVEGSSVSSF